MSPALTCVATILLSSVGVCLAAPYETAGLADGRGEKEFALRLGRDSEGGLRKRRHAADDQSERIRKATLNEGLNIPGIVEGDIMTDSKTEAPTGHRGRRQVVNRDYYGFYATWPRGIVPYNISSTYQASSITVILKAMTDIEQRTCIKFMDVNNYSPGYFGHNNSLYIYSGSGCWSYVGYSEQPNQPVSLNEVGCIYTGVVQHELMHALGFVHTQARPDRDKQVQVMIQNIVAGYEHNFYKSAFPSVVLPTSYDIYSVMHYGLSDFSKGGATLAPRTIEYSKLAGNRVLASFYDEKALNFLYSCAGSCSQSVCQNDGYAAQVNGACVCKCPKGLSGQFCELIDSVNYACGDVLNLPVAGTVTVNSPNYPSKYPTGRSCWWLIKAPPGMVVKISFNSMNLTSDSSKCRHFLDVRKNLLGQPAPTAFCGNGIPNDIYSRDSYSSRAVLVLFDASDTTAPANTGFSLTVSAYTDGCLANPCRGARCRSEPGSSSYTCLLPAGDMYCGFENATATGCNMIRIGDSYDSWSGSVSQVTWETAKTTSLTPGTTAPEGLYYLASNPLYNEYANESRNFGTFRILPFMFPNTTSSRCLRFKYYAYGVESGSLSIYRSVNGNLGSPIFEKTASATDNSWAQAQLTISSTSSLSDIVEIVFKAQHGSHNFELDPIAVDDVEYLAGYCDSGPCASGVCYDGAQCVAGSNSSYSCITPLPDGDVSSSGESWESHSSWLTIQAGFELYSWVAPGHSWPRPTGPVGAATGFSYFYARLYKAAPATATMKIGAFAGGIRCLRFKYSMYGMDMGSLTVYRMVTSTAGAVTNTILWSKRGNQGDFWWGTAVTVNATLAVGQQKIEVQIVAARASNTNYASDMALDDISYTQGDCAVPMAVTSF